MRLVFAGTPRTAVPSLEELLRSKHEVVAVLTRPDAPAGRGRHVGPSPVAECAGSAGIEVLKPASPRDPAFLDRLRALEPDCCPVTAYGALTQTLDGMGPGALRAEPQPAEGISYAPKLTTGDARVRWDHPALAVGRQIRACTPAPGAWTMLADARLKLWPVRDAAGAPGGE